jgi:hypothetical protein
MLGRLFYRWEMALAAKDTSRSARPFAWGTEFLDPGCHLDDPLQYLIRYARAAVEKSDAFYSYPAVVDFRLEEDHLTFTSPLATVYPENNITHGRYFPAKSRGRVILVLPQWNSGAQGHVALCRLLNRFGLSALRLSLPYHDRRMPEGQVRADYMLSPNLGRTLQAVRQAVIDARAAIDWLESEGYKEFAVLGTSLGSCVAMITQAHDRRVKLSVLNHVSPYFADVVWTGLSTRHVRAGLEGHIGLARLRRVWMPLSPRAYFERMAGTGKASFLIHAIYDYSFLPHLSRIVLREYNRLRIPHTHLALPCGHYSSGEFPFNVALGLAICNYLRRNL